MRNDKTLTGGEAQCSRWWDDEQDLLREIENSIAEGEFSMLKITYTIEYQYGTYSGEHEVTLNEDDGRDPCDVMWAQMSKQGLLGLSMAYRSAKVIDEQYED